MLKVVWLGTKFIAQFHKKEQAKLFRTRMFIQVAQKCSIHKTKVYEKAYRRFLANEGKIC